MIENDPVSAHSSVRTKETLIDVARKLFAERGYDGTTIKDIVDAAGVNASLVSYHFNGKEGLFQACIKTMGQAHRQMAQQVLTPPENQSELRVRLELFVSAILSMHQENPDVIRIIHQEIDRDSALIQTVFKTVYIEVFEIIQNFIKSGQLNQLIRPDLDPFISSAILVGSMVQFGKSDRICSRYFGQSIQDNEFKQRVVKQIVDIFLTGAQIKEPS